MKYSKRMVKRIVTLIESDDYTIKEICEQCGIHVDTWYDWKHNRPDFSEAIKKAEENRLDLFAKAARSGLLTLLRGKEYEEVVTEYIEGKPDAQGNSKPKIKAYKKTKKFIPPNPTSVIFTLKNLDEQNFADIIRQEVTGKDGKEFIPTSKIDYSKFTEEELIVLKQLHDKATTT
jgi:transposase